jgi:hypothetical protein
MSKAGKLTTQTLNTAIIAIILVVVLFKLYAVLVPEAQTAGDELNASGVPFGSLFTGGGLVFVLIMVALLIVIVRAFMPGK